jgi:hypothetical protein
VDDENEVGGMSWHIIERKKWWNQLFETLRMTVGT